ncbi:MAG: metallophosphoesterase [Clostridia bacterium]|nr:metallophosphoesterase [Clostridia bacterium]
MRFIHMADIHLDTPFSVLALKGNLSDIRRLEQREAFKKAIEYISKENIPFLFISGDLYEQEYIRESTIEYINNLFKEIPKTKIFISPGNHDPFLNNSFYNKFNWNNNVKIFNSEIEKIELEEVDIYGYGFSDFYCTDFKIEELKIKNKNKINILIIHGSLDASKTLDMQYNPINSVKLKQIGFDYVALGHIHKTNYNNNKNNFIYPGSLISFGFDELGEHGILDVEINKNKLINEKIKSEKINFIKLDNKIFEEKNIDISLINSEEELIEKINKTKLESNKFYKIILEGTKNIEINIPKLCKLTTSENILKLKDKTEEKYDIESLANQKNLKGIFVKKMLQRLKDNSEEKDEIKKAMEIGLKLFD